LSTFLLSIKNQTREALSFLNRLVNKGHGRSIKAKKNILAGLFIKGGSIAISLFLVPLTIHYINPTQYGIWITLSSIIGWFSFFDIGFGHGLRNKFAESVAIGDYHQARIYISTTYAIISIIIGIVLCLFFFINPFLNWSKILNAPLEMEEELSLLALIVFIFFCLQFILQLITTVLTANQEPAKASLYLFLANLISALIIFVLTKTTSGNLIYLGIAYSSVPVIVLFLSTIWFYKYKKKYKIFAPALRYVKFGYTKDLMGLGIKFFLLQIAGIVLYQTSNIIIAQLFGPDEVTPYNIAFKYFSIITMLLGIIMTPFWSAYTEAWVKKDIAWIKNVFKKQQKLWFGLVLLTIIMIAVSNVVYELWVGEEIVVPMSLSVVMGSYVLVNTWNMIYALFFNGVGKIKLQLYTSILDMIVHIPLAIYLGKILGPAGVILSVVILSGLNMIWAVIQFNKIINNKAAGIWNQ
jgi:O-antigen/teichoic acid export membrane protein